VGNVTVRPAKYDCDASQRIIDRSAHAQLPVDTFISGSRDRQKHTSQQFVRLKAPIVVADACIELAQRNRAFAAGANDLNLGVQAEERWRGVSAEGRPALGPARRDVAEVTVFFYAEPAGFSPLQRLVVPKTACVEADIAADRPHVAQDGRSD